MILKSEYLLQKKEEKKLECSLKVFFCNCLKKSNYTLFRSMKKNSKEKVEFMNLWLTSLTNVTLFPFNFIASTK